MKKLLVVVAMFLFTGCNLTIGDYCYGPVGLFHGQKVVVDSSCGFLTPKVGEMSALDVQHTSEYLECRDHSLNEHTAQVHYGYDVCSTSFRSVLATMEDGYIVFDRYTLNCQYIHCVVNYETRFF